MNTIIDWTWDLVKLGGGIFAIIVLAILILLIGAILFDQIFPSVLNRQIEEAGEDNTEHMDLFRIYRSPRPSRTMHVSDRARWADLIHPRESSEDDTKFLEAIKGFNDDVR